MMQLFRFPLKNTNACAFRNNARVLNHRIRRHVFLDTSEASLKLVKSINVKTYSEGDFQNANEEIRITLLNGMSFRAMLDLNERAVWYYSYVGFNRRKKDKIEGNRKNVNERRKMNK